MLCMLRSCGPTAPCQRTAHLAGTGPPPPQCLPLYHLSLWPLPCHAGKWSAAGSLAEAGRPRLYHSTAVLLPDCTVGRGPPPAGLALRPARAVDVHAPQSSPQPRPAPHAPPRTHPQVFTAGSDVTWDQTAEIFQPPYLFKGPRPDITSVHPTRLQVSGGGGWRVVRVATGICAHVPACPPHCPRCKQHALHCPRILSLSPQPGADLVVDYTSEDPVTRALLLRGGAQTHSVGFGACAGAVRGRRRAAAAALGSPYLRGLAPPSTCLANWPEPRPPTNISAICCHPRRPPLLLAGHCLQPRWNSGAQDAAHRRAAAARHVSPGLVRGRTPGRAPGGALRRGGRAWARPSTAPHLWYRRRCTRMPGPAPCWPPASPSPPPPCHHCLPLQLHGHYSV